tara:strand:- start:1018 stop:1824 length:807 start_codon:yes stop_codon:yes gene_type:complete
MIVKKIIIMLLVLLILYIISRNNENFFEYISSKELKRKLRGEYYKSVNEKRAKEAAARAEAERQRRKRLRSVMLRTPNSKLLSMQKKKNDISETHLQTDDMNLKAKVNRSMINLDPKGGGDKNINVGNDIIVKKGFKLNGYPYTIDIPFLRYLKYLPVHFEKEFCLNNSTGTACMNKKHIEVVKGERKINLTTYPENQKRCLGAKTVLHKKTLNQGPTSNNIFGDQKCENGNTANEFVFVRDEHRHGDKNETHFHSHIINDEPHSHIN